MKRDKHGRRTFLSSLGLGAAYLPLLHADRARAAGFPKRLMTVVWTNGAIAKDFWPTTADETQFNFNRVMKPLEPFRKKLLVLDGIQFNQAIEQHSALTTQGHHSMYCVLTGKKGQRGVIYGDQPYPIADCATIDQAVATGLEAKGIKTPIKTLELGPFPGEKVNTVSFRGPAIGPAPYTAQSNLPEFDPAKVFARLFAGGSTPGAPTVDVALARLRAERRSVLDHVSRDLTTFAGRLGTEDRMKVQSHLDSIRQIETELVAPLPTTSGAACTKPVAPTTTAAEAKNLGSFAKNMQLHMDLAVAALACNVTSVVTLMLSNQDDGYLSMPWLGVSNSHHGVAHDAGKMTAAAEQKNSIDTWFMTQHAYLLLKMDAVQEGTGTMLDNSVVYLTNHMGDGALHDAKRIPTVLAGGCGGYFRTGRYLRFGGVSHNGILVALSNAMGVPATFFGDPAYGGQLSGLV